MTAHAAERPWPPIEAPHAGPARRTTVTAPGRRGRATAAGEGPSPTSGPAPKDIEAQRDGEILSEWKRQPGLGPSQIRNQLRRGGVEVSVNTVRRVMEDAGYRPPKVKREPHAQRYEALRPNQLWHLAFSDAAVSKHLLIRLDNRGDFADEAVFFAGRGNAVKNRLTSSLGIVAKTNCSENPLERRARTTRREPPGLYALHEEASIRATAQGSRALPPATRP